MRLLAICESPPTLDPQFGNGSTLITALMLPALPASIELSLAYFADRPIGPDDAVLQRARRVTRLPLRDRTLGMVATPALTVPRATWARETQHAREAIVELARDADVVYLHGLHTFSSAAEINVPTVVHEIDPWSLYWRERSLRRFGPRGLYDRIQSRQGLALERQTAKRVARYLVVNADDALRLERLVGRPVDAMPNGVDLTHFTPAAHLQRDSPTVGFLGTLDYPPNIRAVRELALAVFPQVKSRVPDARLVIAGRRPGAKIRELEGPGVEVLGDVEDVTSVYARVRVIAYPGDHGYGTKNTVTESMAAGCAVVASSKALRGVRAGGHASVCDTPTEMADRIVRLLEDDLALCSQVEAARNFVAELPTWNDVAERYATIFNEVDRRGRSQSSP